MQSLTGTFPNLKLEKYTSASCDYALTYSCNNQEYFTVTINSVDSTATILGLDSSVSGYIYIDCYADLADTQTPSNLAEIYQNAFGTYPRNYF